MKPTRFSLQRLPDVLFLIAALCVAIPLHAELLEEKQEDAAKPVVPLPLPRRSARHWAVTSSLYAEARLCHRHTHEHTRVD